MQASRNPYSHLGLSYSMHDKESELCQSKIACDNGGRSHRADYVHILRKENNKLHKCFICMEVLFVERIPKWIQSECKEKDVYLNPMYRRSKEERLRDEERETQWLLRQTDDKSERYHLNVYLAEVQEALKGQSDGSWENYKPRESKLDSHDSKLESSKLVDIGKKETEKRPKTPDQVVNLPRRFRQRVVLPSGLAYWCLTPIV